MTHTEPQFRRAFAEVFRSRSLLFLGSSLADQYLLNLFGETLELFGGNPFPHYALVLKRTTDPDFLRTRLNIFAYEYDSHDCLPELLEALAAADVLAITADHGNDPTTPSTDHSREHVPLLVYGRPVRAGTDLGTRTTFADLGQTLAELFGVGELAAGTSFLAAVRPEAA